jgi:hypothetical protein
VSKRKVTPQEHTVRILKLAAFLAEQKNSKRGTTFEMTTWGEHDPDHAPKATANFCGTAACALGHAGIMPEFRKLGLKLKFPRRPSEWNNLYEGRVEFDGLSSEYAGAKFFGLTHEEASNLFLDTNQTKEDVIRHLCNLATNREEVSSE